MHSWESIQITLDLIENNLTEEISIADLSKAANLSTFYYQRLFKRLTNKTVMEYIKLRRLANAADYLATHKDRILDTALRFGFDNHETFTRSFKDTYGLTPEEYRSSPTHLNKFLKPELFLNYTLIDENVPLIVDDIVLEIKRKKIETSEMYIGLSREIPISQQLPIGEATGVDIPGQLWEKFHSTKSTIPGISSDNNEIGASYLCENKEDYFAYFVGAKTNSNKLLDKDYKLWEMPAGEYIVCCVETENAESLVTSALDKAYKYFFETWLKNHELITKPFSAEKYYKNTSDFNYMEIWVTPIISE